MTAPAEAPRAPTGDDDAALRLGLAVGVAAYAAWGLFPAYIKALENASAMEILAHRIVWAAPFGALVLFWRRQWPEVLSAVKSPRVLLMLTISAVAIAANWGVYVWAVVADRVLEASLGYYINPLMYVAAGVFILREKLRPAQAVAVGLAAAGVAVLTFGAGAFPWAAVALALFFTTYGYVRKTTPVGAMPGLFIETVILTPAAAGFLIWLSMSGAAAFAAGDKGLDALLIFAGPLTVVPLVCFALAARRLRLTTLGILQYIAPTGQFILGIAYGEAFTLAHGICFALIWTGLAIFSVDAIRANQAERLARSSAPLSQSVSKSPKNS